MYVIIEKTQLLVILNLALSCNCQSTMSLISGTKMYNVIYSMLYSWWSDCILWKASLGIATASCISKKKEKKSIGNREM